MAVRRVVGHSGAEAVLDFLLVDYWKAMLMSRYVSRLGGHNKRRGKTMMGMLIIPFCGQTYWWALKGLAVGSVRAPSRSAALLCHASS